MKALKSKLLGFCIVGAWLVGPGTPASGITIIWQAPNTEVFIGVPFGEAEFENPLTGTETVKGYPMLEWRDADYAAPAWYDDWNVSHPGPGEITGNVNEIWMWKTVHSIWTSTTVPSTVVSIHLAGDYNDGLAQIMLDAVEVARLDMGSIPTDRAIIIVKALANTTHQIRVNDLGQGAMGYDVATLGAAALGKEPVPNLKWSQPPIEIDPNTHIPTYCGWDEKSYRDWVEGFEPRWFDCWDCRTQCYGDADCDGDVDADDEAIVMASGGCYPPPPYNPCADFDHDTCVMTPDLFLLRKYLGTYPPPDCAQRPQSWRMAADDFRCLGSMPVKSIHWWGSYFGWEDPANLPPVLPIRWLIGFWTNVAPVPGGDPNYSHPNKLLWQVEVDAARVKVETAGTDDYFGYYPYDVCYQYYLDFEPNELFWQDNFLKQTHEDTFWLSIAAVYDIWDEPQYPWGWKTRPWSWMDDAVRFRLYEAPNPAEAEPCDVEPIKDPRYSESFDLAFELDTGPDWVKWEQPFVGIRRWSHYEDELSMAYEDVNGALTIRRLVADDWPCRRHTPITACVWWGSYIGYRYQACALPVAPLPVKPDYFLLQIWDDVPAGVDLKYSHPNNVIWEHKAYNYDEVLVGYDKHPEDTIGPPREPVFRYSVRLPKDAWFRQRDVNDIYWFSVMAIYRYGTDPLYDWGWTNHKHMYNDDAVEGYWDPPGGWYWHELYDQTGESQDMSFMLFTWPWPPCWGYPTQCHGDTDNTGDVKGSDFLALKNSWYKVYPHPQYDPCADFDRNGEVKGSDFLILKTYWYASPPPDCPRGGTWPP
jgi:hypothetical protein